MPVTDDQLAQILLENQVITQDRLKKAQEVVVSQKTSLADEILEQDLASDEQLGKLIADFLKVPFQF